MDGVSRKMIENYIPSVKEGVYPNDGGWLENEQDRPTLVLSIPEFLHFINVPIPKFDYAWLYNQEINAYIFCFRLKGLQQIEKTIIFHEEHAGILIKDENAFKHFDISITSEHLEDVNEETNYLYLPNITITRHPAASW
jgi:hypothetical protein